jgi:hypothetical protein
MKLCCMGRIQEHCIEANRPNHRSLILPTAELKPVVPATLEIETQGLQRQT